MNTTPQVLQQIERLLRKTAEKLPTHDDKALLTDLHIQVREESGELRVYNDDGEEITRCVVTEWIGNHDADFMQQAEQALRTAIQNSEKLFENCNLLCPYAFVLLDEEGEVCTELHYMGDEVQIMDCQLMAKLDEDLEAFWKTIEEKD